MKQASYLSIMGQSLLVWPSAEWIGPQTWTSDEQRRYASSWAEAVFRMTILRFWEAWGNVDASFNVYARGVRLVKGRETMFRAAYYQRLQDVLGAERIQPGQWRIHGSVVFPSKGSPVFQHSVTWRERLRPMPPEAIAIMRGRARTRANQE